MIFFLFNIYTYILNMEQQNITTQNYNAKIINELKNLFLIKKQNELILKKIKQIEDLYNNTINALLIQINEKKYIIQNLNDIFLENNKHLKYILSELSDL